MRFMMLLKSDKNAEAGAMPDQKLLAAMTKYNEELVKAGVLLTGEGLHPSKEGFRIRNSGGKITVSDGPFAEAKELIAGFWMIQVKSKEEAIEWAKRVPFDPSGASATTGGEGEIDVFPVIELANMPAGDEESGWREQQMEFRGGKADGPIAITPKPDEAGGGAKKMRFMMMFKADARTEAGLPPSEKLLTEMGNLMAEMAQSGKLLAGEGLQPSSKAARIKFSGGKRTVIDGPFAEAKELIAGFAIFQVSSKEEAIDIAKRGSLVNGDGDAEARRVFEASDFGAELTPELRATEERLRAQVAAQQH